MTLRYFCLSVLAISIVSCAHHHRDDIEIGHHAVRSQARFSLETPTRKIIGISMFSVSSDGRFFCELQYPTGMAAALISLKGNQLEYLDLTRRCYLKTGLFQELFHRELGLELTGDMIWEWFGILPEQEKITARSYQTNDGAMIMVKWSPGSSDRNGTLIIAFPDRDIRIVLSMEYFKRDEPDNCRWTFNRDRFSPCETNMTMDLF